MAEASAAASAAYALLARDRLPATMRVPTLSLAVNKDW